MAKIESGFSELVFHVFRYVIDELSRNNLDALIEIGFEIEDVSRLSDLTLADIQRLSGLSRHFISQIKVNRDSFVRLIDRLEEAKQENEFQDDLIRVGAPHGLMSELFGMNGHEYAGRRKKLGLTRVGRPPMPTEEQQAIIFSVWETHKDLDGSLKWLKMGQDTGICLTTVWPLVSSWERTRAGRSQSRSKPSEASIYEARI